MTQQDHRRHLLKALRAALRWSTRNDRLVGQVASLGCYAPIARYGFKSEWGSWDSMKQRVFRPKGRDGDYYAHVDMDPRWSAPYSGFDAFLMDMGPKPDPTYTIDRISKGYGYWPWNCRWADKTKQTHNRVFVGEQISLPL